MKAMFTKVCKNHGFVKTEQGQSLFCYFGKVIIENRKYTQIGEIVEGEIVQNKKDKRGFQFEISSYMV